MPHNDGMKFRCAYCAQEQTLPIDSETLALANKYQKWTCTNRFCGKENKILLHMSVWSYRNCEPNKQPLTKGNNHEHEHRRT